jgi:hypothetical protein
MYSYILFLQPSSKTIYIDRHQSQTLIVTLLTKVAWLITPANLAKSQILIQRPYFYAG